jgi:hypothetical protein
MDNTGPTDAERNRLIRKMISAPGSPLTLRRGLNPGRNFYGPPREPARAKREIIVGPVAAAAAEPDKKLQPKGSWEQQQAADQDDEARLKRKLVICRACLPPESARGDATGSVRR